MNKVNIAGRLGLASFLVLVALATPAQASFTVTTAVTGASYSGGALTVHTLAANTSYAFGTTSLITGAQGGTSYTNSLGTTVYFIEDDRSGSNRVIPNEQIYVGNNNISAVDTGTFTFTTLINVLNNGATGTFNEGSSSLVLNLTSGDSNFLIAAGALAPASQIIGGQLFLSSNPQATSGQVNSLNNGAVSAVITTSAVPEPGSLALLGLGTLGLVGCATRRRSARVESRTEKPRD